ncbi:MAG TPA: hypothetical protein VGL17_09170 [Gemmatimonadaceae bacterium]|jgi:hypothetical protein
MRVQYLLLAALGGCVGNLIAVNQVPTNPAPHALVGRSPGDVKIVSTPPAEPFAEIGFLEGEPVTDGRPVKPDAILYKMREAAGRWGCDYLLITSSTFTKNGRDAEGYGGIGYHGTCLVLLDAARSAAMATSPATPAMVDHQHATGPAVSHPFSSPSSAPPSASAVSTHKLLFRTSEGNLYRVAPESREEAVRAGWVQVGQE